MKGFLLLYLMTCALTIFINFRLRIGPTIYLGDFDDFTPSWFKSIGYSLSLTLTLKILAALGFAFLKKMKNVLPRCFDRGFSTDMAKTKKKIQNEYEKLYTNDDFNIDFCYTEVINIIFVSMTLSPLLPYVFYIALVYLVVIYWRDKYMCKVFFMLVLTNSKIPPNFDESMSQRARGILSAVVPIYLILCVWIFGNINILDETDLSYAQLVESNRFVTLDTIKNNTSSYESFFGPLVKFFDRCTSGNAIYFFLVLLAYCLYLIARFLLGSFMFGLIKLICTCNKKGEKLRVKNKNIHYCWRVPDVFIADEVHLDQVEQESGHQDQESIFYKLRQKRISQYKNKKVLERKYPKLKSLPLFTMLPHYDYRLHPNLKDLFLHN